jgi:hypothetical protein
MSLLLFIVVGTAPFNFAFLPELGFISRNMGKVLITKESRKLTLFLFWRKYSLCYLGVKSKSDVEMEMMFQVDNGIIKIFS